MAPAQTSPLYAELVDLVRNNRALFVVGTGVSVNATDRAPNASWVGLIKNGLRYVAGRYHLGDTWAASWTTQLDAAAERGDVDELVTIASLVERKLGGYKRKQGSWGKWLTDTVGKLRVVDKSLVTALHCLGRGRLATCNYDDILIGDGYPVVLWTNYDRVIRVLNGSSPGVIHLHGHWETPDSVVFGFESYADVLDNKPAQALQNAFATLTSLVFVGFGGGLEDPNLGNLLRWVTDTFPSKQTPNFKLVRSSELPKDGDPDKGMVTLSYGAEYTGLAPFLNRLAVDAGLNCGPQLSALVKEALEDLETDDLLLLLTCRAFALAGNSFRVPPAFKHSDDRGASEFDSQLHLTLRALRDAGLIRPRERGSWQPGKEIEMTSDGTLVFETGALALPDKLTPALWRDLLLARLLLRYRFDGLAQSLAAVRAARATNPPGEPALADVNALIVIATHYDEHKSSNPIAQYDGILKRLLER